MIVSRNMRFDEKIKTLRTLVNFFLTDKGKAEQFDAMAKARQKNRRVAQ